MVGGGGGVGRFALLDVCVCEETWQVLFMVLLVYEKTKWVVENSGRMLNQLYGSGGMHKIVLKLQNSWEVFLP